MRTHERLTVAVRERLDPPPPDDPRGEVATIASGRSERTPVGVFAAVAVVIAVVFAIALVAVVIAYVVS
ncbi:MAG TPA: hypothetical protein VFK76_09780 [Gaiellaceae bacterium]|nr:hypothetical protein [Gaiellaceae bacterium]